MQLLYASKVVVDVCLRERSTRGSGNDFAVRSSPGNVVVRSLDLST